MDIPQLPGALTSALIDEWMRLSRDEAVRNGTAAAAIHAACNLCDRLLETGAMTAKEAVGDYGLVHMLAHLAAGDTGTALGPLHAEALRLEKLAGMTDAAMAA